MSNNGLVGLNALDLVMGYHCNVRCTFCFQSDFSTRYNLESRIWRENLLPAYEVVDDIVIQGGEPTIMKNCIELHALLREKYPHVKLGMNTNGTRLEGLIEETVLAQGGYISFSINAVEKAVYDQLMLKSDHGRVFANLERLVRRRNELNRPLDIGVSLLMVQPNLFEIAPLIRYADRLKVNVMITHDWILSTEVDLKMAQRALAEGYDAADESEGILIIGLNEYDRLLANHYHVEPVREPEPGIGDQTVSDTVCPIAFERLFVDHDGICQVCCQSWYPIGDLKEQSVLEVWNGKRLKTFRERLKRGDYRDCSIVCPHNSNPEKSIIATLRKTMFKLSRDPHLYFKKARSKLRMRNEFRKLKDKAGTASTAG